MKDTPWGKSSKVDLSASLHTDVVPQQLHAFDTKAQFDKNNGIYQDGGISSLYEKAYINNYDKFVYLSNGRKVGLTNTGNIYLDDNLISNNTSSRTSILATKLNTAKYYFDICVLDDGSICMLYVNDTNFNYDIFDYVTGEIITSGTFFAINTINDILAATFVRAHSMTIASITNTTGIIVIEKYQTTWYAYYNIAGTQTKIKDLDTSVIEQFDNLSAYYNGGTTVVCLTRITGAGTGVYTAHDTDWTTWTLQQHAGLDGLNLGLLNLNYIDTTMKIYAATSDHHIPVFSISLAADGAISVASAAGEAFPNFADFTMEAGYVYPLYGGCGGIYSTAGVAPYGSFIGANYVENLTGVKPVLIPDADNMGGTISGFRPVTYKGEISWYSSAIDLNFLPLPLTDVGDNIYSTSSFANTQTAGLWKCPFTRDLSSGGLYPDTTLYPSTTLYPADSNFMLALFSRDKLFYVFSKESTYKNANFQEIAPGVVSFGFSSGISSILDSNTGILYDNLSGVVFSLFTTYTSASSLAYFQRKNMYSNSLDYGLMEFDFDGLITSNENATNNNCALYNGATGAYYQSLIDVAGDPVVNYYEDSALTASTYSFNTYISPGISAEFQDFGIKMLSMNAIQQPNYFGYQQTNMFNFSYEAFFNLQGTQYCYDGSKIYIVPFQNGYASAISGVPQIVCFANGLKYLCSAPDEAYFLSTWDNTLVIFDGGRSTIREQSFSNRSAIQEAVYNARESALIMRSLNSVLTMRKTVQGTEAEYIITENTLPYVNFRMDNTADGVYFVNTDTYQASMIRTYVPIVGSTVIPLNVQTAWFGMQDNQTMVVTRLVGRLHCDSNITSTLQMYWHWTTQDESGVSSVYTITTANRNSSGYFTFDINPTPSMVLGASLEIVTDNLQKFTIIELEWFYKPDADANISNHVA